MTFIASKVIWALVAPGNALVLLLALGAALMIGGGGRAAGVGRALVVAAAVGAVTLAVVPVGVWLMRPLEDRFPAIAPPGRVDGIVVLGGAVNPELAAARRQPSVGGAAERMLAFADLARRFPEARLVFTGGNGSLWDAPLREADVARMVLEQAGLDTRRVLFEGESRNTWENAVLSLPLARPQADETWLLVTSAAHMPRAVGIFRQVGWPVTAYPVDYQTRGDGRPYLILDLLNGLEMTTVAAREWVGLVAYRVMGRTNALFPGPENRG